MKNILIAAIICGAGMLACATKATAQHRIVRHGHMGIGIVLHGNHAHIQPTFGFHWNHYPRVQYWNSYPATYYAWIQANVWTRGMFTDQYGRTWYLHQGTPPKLGSYRSYRCALWSTGGIQYLRDPTGRLWYRW